MLLLDLETCRRAYSPTHFQQKLFPAAISPRSTSFSTESRPTSSAAATGVPRTIGNRSIPLRPGL